MPDVIRSATRVCGCGALVLLAVLCGCASKGELAQTQVRIVHRPSRVDEARNAGTILSENGADVSYFVEPGDDTDRSFRLYYFHSTQLKNATRVRELLAPTHSVEIVDHVDDTFGESYLEIWMTHDLDYRAKGR